MRLVLGFVGLIIFIVCMIGLAAAITWLVVKISPTKTGKKPVAKTDES
ncbi:MAG TPA: hypothetical protein VII83_08245 [Gaiellaceae bacterium]|jgi:hypothetical protein